MIEVRNALGSDSRCGGLTWRAGAWPSGTTGSRYIYRVRVAREKLVEIHDQQREARGNRTRHKTQNTRHEAKASGKRHTNNKRCGP
jgi:hypothetical protein